MSYGLGLVNPLQHLLSTFQRERHFKTKHEHEVEKDKQAALEAILTALTETRKYVDSHVYDRDTEYKLSELWSLAAIRSRKSIESLQPEILVKMQYWLDGIRWDREVLREKGVDLQTVEAKFRELIVSA